MAKPKVATGPMIYRLNALGALKLVPTGSTEPVTYDEAWATIGDAVERGLWTPKPQKPKVGLEREGWDTPPEAA